MNRIIALMSGALMVIALAAVVFAPTVLAHAEMASCTPPINGTVEHAPEKVVCKATQGLDPKGSSLQVFDAAGTRVDKGDSQVDLNDPDRLTIMVSLDTSKMKDGVYTVKWVTVSLEDGDQASGEFTFTVGHATSMEQPTPAALPSEKDGIKIAFVSPQDGATVPAGNVNIEIHVEGVTLGPDYHWHLYVDDKLVTMVTEPTTKATLKLEAGEHHLKATLAEKDHGDIVGTEIHVQVTAAAQAATPTHEHTETATATETATPTHEHTETATPTPATSGVTLPASGGTTWPWPSLVLIVLGLGALVLGVGLFARR